jgi:hypothetical protein
MTPSEPGPRWRLRARSALEGYFRRHTHPRFILSLLVITSGVVGFAVSWVLLHYGMVEMWQRYPLAVIGGYIAFLVQLRLWVEIERERYVPEEVSIPTETSNELLYQPDRKFISDGRSWLDWLDAPLDFISLDEGCLVGCFITLVVGGIIGVCGLMFSFIMAGSELLAELFLDAVVVTMLYRHLKNAARQYWLGTAVRRSWRLVIVIAVALSLLGACLSVLAPNSPSFGKALREIMHGTDSQ